MDANDDDAEDGALTERERQFVLAYTTSCHGNAAEAARLAGYAEATAAKQGSRLLRRPRVRAAIEAATEGDPLIATRAERMRFWTRVMRGKDEPAEMKDRLKASELLGKAAGDFVDRLEVQVDLNGLTDEQLARIAAGEDPGKVMGGK